MQDEVFPDDDDFGRIFRNNAVLSARGHPPVRRDHGQLRRGRGLPAGPLRHGADDRGVGPLPRRARRWSRRRSARTSPHEELGGADDARGDQRDGRLPRARRRLLPRPPPPADRACSRPTRAVRRPTPRSSRPRGPADEIFYDRPHRPLGAVRRARPARRRSSTAAGSTSTAPSTARRSSAASPGWEGCRSGSSPTSGCGSGPTGAARSSSAA